MWKQIVNSESKKLHWVKYDAYIYLLYVGAGDLRGLNQSHPSREVLEQPSSSRRCGRNHLTPLRWSVMGLGEGSREEGSSPQSHCK